MCEKCGCGVREEKKKKYECKKCGRVSDRKEICCGQEMIEKK